MTTGLTTTFEAFVADVRRLFQTDADEDSRWRSIADLLGGLLRDDHLQREAESWPVSKRDDGKATNLVLYEDPEYGFVVNGLVKAPGGATPVHDHGPAWTLYGSLTGGEQVVRYRRTDDGPQMPERAVLERTLDIQIDPGEVDTVPPWTPHVEYNGTERSVAIIVRSQRPGTYLQNDFNLETGTVFQRPGPVQVPYPLAE